MKQYGSVKEIAQASVEALDQYKNLMSGSAIIYFLASEQDKENKQQEVMKNLADKMGVPHHEVTTTQVPLKDHAEEMYQKIQEYRQTSPQFVVDMFDEGLGFLEELCEKYR